jgi:hypothetical protein
VNTGSSAIDWTQRYRVPNDVLVRRVDDMAVLLELRTRGTYSLDEIGTRVFDAVVGSDSLGAAITTLLAEYDVEIERLRADVRELVAELAKRGLLERRSG